MLEERILRIHRRVFPDEVDAGADQLERFIRRTPLQGEFTQGNRKGSGGGVLRAIGVLGDLQRFAEYFFGVVELFQSLFENTG